MVLYGSTIPESKRFFKISELAGKRWPSVTEDEIYNWHDAGYKVHVACDGFPELVDVTCHNRWSDAPHFGKINLMAYWIYFPEFFALPAGPMDATIMKYIDEETANSFKGGVETLRKALDVVVLRNSFLMIETDSATGFAYNNSGSVDNLIFYDEQGLLRAPVSLDAATKGWFPSSVRIRKEDLLIRASSVRFLEQIAPEIASAERCSMDSVVFHGGDKARTPTIDSEKESYTLAPGEKTLVTFKTIAEYVGVHPSTIKRNFKEIIEYTPTGRAFTTTARVDAYMAKTASKQNRKKRG